MKKAVIFTISLGLVFFFPSLTYGLTISPPLIELEVEPGQTVKRSVKVLNEAEEPLELLVSVERFRARGEEGQPEFISPEEEDYVFYNWIGILKEPIILAPRERVEVPFVIEVPEKASPGGYYAAIFWSTRPPRDEEGRTVVGVVGKTGSLILLRVKGEAREEGRLAEFSIKESRKFINYLPVNFIIRFENTGNVHLKPQGEIEITNIFNRLTANLTINERRGNVLPESIRKFETEWRIRKSGSKVLVSEPDENIFQKFYREIKNEKNNFAFGKHFAYLNLVYGSKENVAQAELDFWVLPWRILTLCSLVFLAILLFLIWGLKKYNRWIVAKYQKKLMKEEEERRGESGI